MTPIEGLFETDDTIPLRSKRNYGEGETVASATINPGEYYPLADYIRLAKCCEETARRRCRTKRIVGAMRLHGRHWRVPGMALIECIPAQPLPDTPTPVERKTDRRNRAKDAEARAAELV